MRTNRLVLSLFPGVGLLDMGFEENGFCVVRGPDSLWGGDIRRFKALPGIFGGVIGGSPCQDFSGARRCPPTGYGLAMIDEFKRIILETETEWFLLENIVRVPDVSIPGYSMQRIHLNAREVGLRQNRPRAFQFGSLTNLVLKIKRSPPPPGKATPCLTGGSDGIAFKRACAEMGLPPTFDLPPFKRLAKRQAIANGVPPEMARRVAAAIDAAQQMSAAPIYCPCGCGRILSGRQKAASPTCRKRLERRRKRLESE